MSSRAFRRLTEDLNTYDSAVANEEYSLSQHKPQISAFSNFDLLCATPEEHVPPPSADDSNESPPPMKPKKKRKPKKKAQPAKPELSNFVDTIKHDNCHYTDAPISGSKASGNDLCADLLVVNNKTLDPMMELGKLFGNHVIRGATSSQQLHHQTRYHSKRGALVRVKVTWPPVVRFGLDMDKLPCGSYTFIHSKEYRNTQKSFYVALNSMDPNNLAHILTDFPYHVDCLLQLSSILLHQDNSEMSMDLLERVLHAYQSAFHPCFNPALGTCRLDYRRQENRGLFVALFRYAVLIGSRGCYRNALDYCKILLRLVHLQIIPHLLGFYVYTHSILTLMFTFDLHVGSLRLW
ncbi:Transcription factor 25 [Paragonimus heterotremus]|uniref:Transcription factor 25 n=1 Tax=Paragonimus heterotremus TaxID=100268 RepID=A0A8J4SFM0_9TREM|nr:Transcription factor 25 [Paragonimus heterotremus]